MGIKIFYKNSLKQKQETTMKAKNIFFVSLILLLLSSTLFPQSALKQGVYSLSGGISFSSSKNKSDISSDKRLAISISPSFNYFILDNLLVGGNISYNYLESGVEFSSSRPVAFNNFKMINRQFGFGPNVRYYFKGASIIPFAEVEYNYIRKIGTEQSGNFFLAAAGINYFLSNSVALEPFLSYSIGSYKNPDNSTNTFSVGIRINYFIIGEVL